jgi:glutamate formiminotransferase/formiminotetrahydrofolate cyclodeaminase
MDDLTRQSVDDFLDAVAQRTATPGGGSVAAAAGALACALACMVTDYSIVKNMEPGIRDQMETLLNRLRSADEILRGLVTQDAVAYAAMSAAGKAARDNPAAKATYQEAVLNAVAVPLETAAAASHALATMDELKDSANSHLLSDLGVASVLAEAAARAAWYMVAVNLPELTDVAMRTKLRGNIDETVRHCEGYRRSIEAFVRRNLETK